MLVIVAYDIADDRRRLRLRKLLLGHGIPVQESVFECDLASAQINQLKQRIGRMILPEIDRVNYYHLCNKCAAKAEDGAGERHPKQARTVVV